jgi:AraC-like DNA-binding protein
MCESDKIDSAMGEPRYREYPIRAVLASFIKCIWSLESDGPVYDAVPERILPDGCVELVFHFHDPFRTHFANGESTIQPQSFVVGQMKRFLEIAPAGRIGFVAVRFSARNAYRFFPESLREIADGVVDLASVWKQDADEWTERVSFARGMNERLRIMEQALVETLCRNDRADRLVDRCLQLTEARGGQSSVAQLVSEIGTSSRQLTRRFQNAVGISPKEFARVSRFLCALRYLRDGKHETLTETAHACGYFDQAHFNHDFREFAGMTPRELFTFPNVAF